MLKETAGKAAEWPTELASPTLSSPCRNSSVPPSGTVRCQNMRIDNPFRGRHLAEGDRHQARASALHVLHHVTSNHSPDRGAPPARRPGGSVGSCTPAPSLQVASLTATGQYSGGGQFFVLDALHDGGQGCGRPDADRLLHAETGPRVHQTLDRPSPVRPLGRRAKGEARHKEIASSSISRPTPTCTRFTRTRITAGSVELKQKTPDGEESLLLLAAEVRLQLAARLRSGESRSTSRPAPS